MEALTHSGLNGHNKHYPPHHLQPGRVQETRHRASRASKADGSKMRGLAKSFLPEYISKTVSEKR